jgi:hypothetical protein
MQKEFVKFYVILNSGVARDIDIAEVILLALMKVS